MLPSWKTPSLLTQKGDGVYILEVLLHPQGIVKFLGNYFVFLRTGNVIIYIYLY